MLSSFVATELQGYVATQLHGLKNEVYSCAMWLRSYAANSESILTVKCLVYSFFPKEVSRHSLLEGKTVLIFAPAYIGLLFDPSQRHLSYHMC